MQAQDSILEPLEQALADGILPIYDANITDEYVSLTYYRYIYDDHLCASNEAAMQERLDGLNGYTSVTLREHYIDFRNADGELTPAFVELLKIIDELQNHPVLDDDDYERREHEEADGGCIDWYGDEFYADWRAGKLGPDVYDVSGFLATSVYPDPADHADLDPDELPTSGPVYDYIYAHAYAKARDYI